MNRVNDASEADDVSGVGDVDGVEDVDGMAQAEGVDDVKRAQRAAMRRIRTAIPDRAQRAGSIWAQVLDRCRSANARTVLAFVGVGSEPDTSQLVEQLAAAGFRVALPRVEGDHIVAVVHDPTDPADVLVPGAFGIPSPQGRIIDPTAIDVAIVPGLAFTRAGRRLGQGGGFYDRFLPSLRADCMTIGVGFAEQVVEDLATEPHDQYLDIVLTDAVQE